MKRLSIFLIVAALIATVVGCGGSRAGTSYTPTIYTLTINSTADGAAVVNNVTIPGEATFSYDAGMVVSLNATPRAGYHFVDWTGNVDTISNVNRATTSIIMKGDYSIMANFEVDPPAEYTLNIFNTVGGSVTSPGKGSFTYDAGTVVNLRATPASGYTFNKWTGDVGTIANVNAASTNITMNGNCYIVATFRYIPCTGLS